MKMKRRRDCKSESSLFRNLLFVLQTQRNTCDYSIDWIICKVRSPIFSPSYSSALLPLSSQVVHTHGCQDIFIDILEHPVTGSIHRHLNTCPPTHMHAGTLVDEQTYKYFTSPCIVCVRKHKHRYQHLFFLLIVRTSHRISTTIFL